MTAYMKRLSLELASDALITAMDFYFEDRREVPAPSIPKRSDVLVDLPASVAAKVLLLNELVPQCDMAAGVAPCGEDRPLREHADQDEGQ